MKWEEYKTLTEQQKEKHKYYFDAFNKTIHIFNNILLATIVVLMVLSNHQILGRMQRILILLVAGLMLIEHVQYKKIKEGD